MGRQAYLASLGRCNTAYRAVNLSQRIGGRTCRIVHFLNNMDQYNRPRVLGCEPVDGVLVVLSSNQINIATFVHQMGDTHIYHLVNKHTHLPSGEQTQQYVIDLN